MLENDKSYTFLLSHSRKSKIYIRKIEISRRFIQNITYGTGLLFLLSFVSLGVYGVAHFTGFTQSSSMAGNSGLFQAQHSVPVKPQSIDYSSPDDIDEFTANSGGPYDPDGLGEDEAEIERQLAAIQTTGNPANLPTIWAHMGKINNEFGFRRNPFGGRAYEFHAGMDIDGERGDTVIAPAGGTVTEAGWKGGYGQMIEIDHGNGLKTRYGHLSKIEVSAGDTLSRGQLIAYVGSTGRSTGPHLHYELRLNDRPINPRRFLPPEPMELTKG